MILLSAINHAPPAVATIADTRLFVIRNEVLGAIIDDLQDAVKGAA